MEIYNLENNSKNNNLIITQGIELENLERKQQGFLQSNLGQAINSGIDLGLKALLPDVIEDEVIAVKDSLITEGFSAALNTAIDQASNLGKSLTGIVTGAFENISQAQKAIEKGGLIDTVSSLLNTGINWAQEKGFINRNIAQTIKTGKNALLNTVQDRIEDNFSDQVNALDKLNKYIDKWHEYYKQQSFTNMEYQYKRIEEYLEKVMPLQETLKRARAVENLHERIKNNGKNFEITQTEQDLAEIL